MTGLTAFCCMIQLSACCQNIPKASITVTRMHVIKKRIILYAKSYGNLPDNLMRLPLVNGYDMELDDGWNRKILYTFDKSSGVVVLKSLGMDGLAGGADENKDIIRAFHSRGVNGDWNKENIEWDRE